MSENAASVRGRADREAARVRIVVGDEDNEGEADHKGDRAGTDGVEKSASRADKDRVPEDDDRADQNEPDDRGGQAAGRVSEPVPAGGQDVLEAPHGVLVERRGRGGRRFHLLHGPVEVVDRRRCAGAAAAVAELRPFVVDHSANVCPHAALTAAWSVGENARLSRTICAMPADS